MGSWSTGRSESNPFKAESSTASSTGNVVHCLTTGISLLLHGSDDQRAERVIFDERFAVAEDRELAWTLYNLLEIEDRREVPLQATRQALVDKRDGL
jgi:hypothetical protein